jgi:glutathione S-transferase
LKLIYFDFHGGRGEPARLALSIGGIPFEDDRVAPSDWQRRKPDTPFGALPVLEVDEQTLAESNAINRYVGKLTDLYPSDAWQAALCDEVMEAVEDINTKLAATLFLPEEEKKTQRKALVEGPLPFYLTRLQQRLEAHGGRYFAADRLSVADLKVFVWMSDSCSRLSLMGCACAGPSRRSFPSYAASDVWCCSMVRDWAMWPRSHPVSPLTSC